MVLLPQVLWAQRSDKVYLTIDLQEAKDPKISIDNDDEGGKVSFSASAVSHATGGDDHEYAIDLELYGKIDKEASKIAVNPRSVVLVLAKAEPGFWPRLLRQKGKAPNNIKVDWSKWVDEDEEDDKPEFDISNLQDSSNFDLGGGMGGMGRGGMPGMGGGGGGGGMGGMDMEAMMAQMGGMGGGAGGGAAGGPGGGPDMASMQAMLEKLKAGGAGGAGPPGAGGAGGFNTADFDEDSDDDDVPPLETA